jgi:hypothetical protein
MEEPPIVFPLLSTTSPDKGTEDNAEESIETVTEGWTVSKDFPELVVEVVVDVAFVVSEFIVEEAFVVFVDSLAVVVFVLESLEDEVLVAEFDELEDASELELAAVLAEVVEEFELVALEEIVPKENLYREKMGFTISLEDWFKGDLSKYYLDRVNNKSTLNNFVDLSKIDLSDNRKRWNLLMFELWLQSYFK